MVDDKQSGAELKTKVACGLRQITESMANDRLSERRAVQDWKDRINGFAAELEVATRSLPQAGDSKCVECGSLGGTLGNSHSAGCSHNPQAGEAANDEATDRVARMVEAMKRQREMGADDAGIIDALETLLSRAALPPAGEGVVEEKEFDVDRCQDCGGPNPVWFAPNKIWNLVMGGPDAKDDPGGYCCPVCFILRAEAAGIKPTAWELRPEGNNEGE